MASNNGKTINGKWLKGIHENAELLPKSIADKLRGKNFRSFDDFKEIFWNEVSKDSHLSSQFSKSNRARMAKGYTPKAHSSQWNGKNGSYILHHRKPIQHSGGVYDVDNLIIVTPRYHLDVLIRAYHF